MPRARLLNLHPIYRLIDLGCNEEPASWRAVCSGHVFMFVVRAKNVRASAPHRNPATVIDAGRLAASLSFVVLYLGLFQSSFNKYEYFVVHFFHNNMPCIQL